MTPNQKRRRTGDRGIGRDNIGHRDRNLGVELHRLEAVGYDHEVAGDHAMEPYRRFIDGALDAELGEDHQQDSR